MPSVVDIYATLYNYRAIWICSTTTPTQKKSIGTVATESMYFDVNACWICVPSIKVYGRFSSFPSPQTLK